MCAVLISLLRKRARLICAHCPLYPGSVLGWEVSESKRTKQLQMYVEIGLCNCFLPVARGARRETRGARLSYDHWHS